MLDFVDPPRRCGIHEFRTVPLNYLHPERSKLKDPDIDNGGRRAAIIAVALVVGLRVRSGLFQQRYGRYLLSLDPVSAERRQDGGLFDFVTLVTGLPGCCRSPVAGPSRPETTPAAEAGTLRPRLTVLQRPGRRPLPSGDDPDSGSRNAAPLG